MMDIESLRSMMSGGIPDTLEDAKTLLARVIARTSMQLPAQAVQCLVFLEQSGLPELASRYLEYRQYLSPATPAAVSGSLSSLTLEEYLSKIQISLGGK